jgi:HSP20 family protein
MSTFMIKQRPSPAAPARDPFTTLRHEMDELVSRFWGPEQGSWLAPTFTPHADVVETANAFEIRLDAPGLEAKDIDVQVDGNLVRLSGQRAEEKEEQGQTFHRVERRSGSFLRTFTLPCNVNEQEVAAEYAQGVLTVKLPKCEQARAKKVTVKSS